MADHVADRSNQHLSSLVDIHRVRSSPAEEEVSGTGTNNYGGAEVAEKSDSDIDSDSDMSTSSDGTHENDAVADAGVGAGAEEGSDDDDDDDSDYDPYTILDTILDEVLA